MAASFTFLYQRDFNARPLAIDAIDFGFGEHTHTHTPFRYASAPCLLLPFFIFCFFPRVCFLTLDRSPLALFLPSRIQLPLSTSPTSTLLFSMGGCGPGVHFYKRPCFTKSRLSKPPIGPLSQTKNETAYAKLIAPRPPGIFIQPHAACDRLCSCSLCGRRLRLHCCKNAFPAAFPASLQIHVQITLCSCSLHIIGIPISTFFSPSFLLHTRVAALRSIAACSRCRCLVL